MKVLFITHVDVDGVTPVILGKLVFDEVTASFCTYNSVDAKVEKLIQDKAYEEYDMIYITDISVNERVADMIEATCKDKVLLFDHHQTAEWMNKYSWAFVKTTEPYIDGEEVKERKSCGASLFHTYLIKEGYLKYDRHTDDFVEHVRRYDTWDWFRMKDESSKQLSMMLDIIGREKFIAKYVDFIKSFKTLWFDEADMLLLTIEQDKIDRYVDGRKRSIMEMELGGHRIGVVFAEQYKSELGNRLAEDTDYEAIAIVDPGLSVSFRCKEESNVDVSEIAALYDGGGHAKAAGFPLKTEMKKAILNTVFGKGETESA